MTQTVRPFSISLNYVTLWKACLPSDGRGLRIMAFVVLAILYLQSTGCRGATPYTAGYYSRDLDNGTVSVTFTGNNFLDRGTVHSYMLYRCAELAIVRGYDYFIILKERHPEPLLTGGMHENSTIRMLKGPIPPDQISEKTYNAREVIQELRTKYPELQKVPLPKSFDSDDRS